MSEIERLSKESIKKGSKSFAFAGLLLSRSCRLDAFKLYQWCRYCDDEIDEFTDEHKDNNLEHRLAKLREKTQRAFTNPVTLSEPAFIGLSQVVEKYKIPFHYPKELLNGMEMDLRQNTYTNFAELELYCYRVAGVVGLMMSHILGVSDKKALRHACDLGIAMQLTNIARDVFTDADKGRIYLPLDWLAEEGLTAENFSRLNYRNSLLRVMNRLLTTAEKYYQSGDQGLSFLQFRNALAIRSARSIYSRIGSRLKDQNDLAWSNRAYTSKFEKFFLFLESLNHLRKYKTYYQGDALQSKTVIDEVWRFE